MMYDTVWYVKDRAQISTSRTINMARKKGMEYLKKTGYMSCEIYEVYKWEGRRARTYIGQVELDLRGGIYYRDLTSYPTIKIYPINKDGSLGKKSGEITVR